MTRNTVKVKVSVERLLEAVRARREKMIVQHERDVKAYAAKEAAYRKKVVKAIHDVAVRVEDGGDFPDASYNGALNIPCRAKRPSKPDRGTSGVDRLIATLELATDESIPMSADDAARYLG
jgi:hypothetical protein